MTARPPLGHCPVAAASVPAEARSTAAGAGHPAARADALTVPPAPEEIGSTGALLVDGHIHRKRRRTNLRSAASSALRALRVNVGRGMLTALGVIIGVASVIVVVSIGQAATGSITQSLAALGTNVLVVAPGSTVLSAYGTTADTLTEADAQALSTLPGVTATSPVVWSVLSVAHSTHSWSTRVEGAYDSIQQIQNFGLDLGGFFTAEDDAAARPVCVVGHTVVQHLFDQEDPIGQQIKMRTLYCTVIGVLASRGNNGLVDQDDLILLPFHTAQGRLYGSTDVQQILLQGSAADQLPQLQQQIATTIHDRHHLGPDVPDDFNVHSNNQVQETLNKTSVALTILLSGVAAVSLIVGGIGIMNVMLVSVTERTREIGIRMALGARRADVLVQFLLEAVLISASGGLIGLILGALVSLLITGIVGWGASVDMLAIPIAVSFSVAVGVFFGYYPARRAAQLDPIEALRRD